MATSSETIAKLERDFAAIVGAAHVRAAIGAESRCASVVVTPADAGEISEIVRRCEADRIILAPFGAARTLAEIRLAPAAIAVSLARLDRIVAYEPDDMTVVAAAGVTLAALNAATAARGQWLPVDPPRPELTTLGAMVAAARFGPSRLSEGIVRDLLIGVRFVGHDGRIVHGGGNVVKNVAGYDLMKVMTGSFGTLGIITETTFRVRPLPARRLIACAGFADLDSAYAAAANLHDAVPLLHLEVTSPSVSAALHIGAGFALIAGFGGAAPEADYLRVRIPELLGVNNEILDGAAAIARYERIRDFDLPASAAVALIAAPPAELPAILAATPGEFIAHAGSGVARLFLAALDADELGRIVAAIRERARRVRGHVRVMRVASELRGEIRRFDNPPAAAMTLMRRMKTTFDPRGIFNPGCFVGGL